MLSPDQIKAREGLLTASRVGVLMGSDERAVYDLWRELTGDPAYEPEDLSGIWAVQLGACTEQLNLDWFARKYGPVSRRGEVVKHANGWAAATLDGWADDHSCPIEVKHTGGREPLATVQERYAAQMHWQMFVTGTDEIAFSVILGANEPLVDFIPRDDAYMSALVARAERFMACVWSLTPPVTLPPIAPPVKTEKIYDMTGSNTWGAEAATWLSTRAAARDCAAAEKALKKMVPADASWCHGAGIEIHRDRAGRLSLKEQA